MRLAVVVTRLRGVGALARNAVVAFPHHRPGRLEAQVEGKFASGDAHDVGVAGAFEHPRPDEDTGGVLLGFGQSESRTRRALIVPQALRLRIAQGGVREQELPWRKGAVAARVD